MQRGSFFSRLAEIETGYVSTPASPAALPGAPSLRGAAGQTREGATVDVNPTPPPQCLRRDAVSAELTGRDGGGSGQ